MELQAKLQLLYQELRKFELHFDLWNESEALRIAQVFDELSQSSNFEMQKISELKKHLKKDLKPEQLGHLLIPIERYLQRNIDDADFIVLTKDQLNSVTEKAPVRLILHNLRSAFNVGSLIRTAECLNIKEVIFCGYTATPENDKTLRTAMGTESLISWRSEKDLENCLLQFHEQGLHTVAFETTTTAVSWDHPYPQKECALILGNERFGLEERHLKMCSEVRSLPTRGQKNSLNVSVAGAVALYEWYRQWR